MPIPPSTIGEAKSERQWPVWADDRLVASVIFLSAALIRFAHFSELAIHDPFYSIPSVDGAVYDAWARQMLAGDWLGDGVLFMGPLYPIFMTAIYAVFGESLPAIKAIQIGLGALSCVLIWGLAREAFDRRVAALAGFLAIFHGMMIFYGGTVMVVNIQIPLVIGLVWALMRALARPSHGRWALCGLLLGLSVLARQTMLLLAPLVVIWIVYRLAATQPLRERLHYGATFGAALMLLILPFSIKNYVAGDDLVLLNSTGGANFYMGNQRGADGAWQLPSIGARVRIDNPETMRREFTRAAEEATGRSMKASEVSSYWLGRGLDEIAADPVRWIRLELRKLGLFVNAYEIWNNRSFEVSQRFSWVLRSPLVGFGLITPFGLLGVVLSRTRWRDLAPIYGAMGAYLASALLFFVLSRYRMPAALLLIPFAAFATFELLDGIRARRGQALLLQAGLLVAFAVLVQLPIASENRMHMAYYNLGNKFRELERWDEAVDAYHESLTHNPNAISTYNNLALALEGGGGTEAAISAWETVGRLANRNRDARRAERAARHLRHLRELRDQEVTRP